MIYLLEMAIFDKYVSLLEGNLRSSLSLVLFDGYAKLPESTLHS